MLTIFRYTLARYRGTIIGWGLALFLMGWPLISVYDVMVKEQKNIEKMMESFGEMVTAFAGRKIKRIDSPDDFLTLRYFAFMPIILGVYAVLTGSGLLAADEENGTLDLVQAQPVSRNDLFLGRLLAFVSATAALMGIAWLGLIIPMQGTALADRVTLGQVALAFVPLLAVLLWFGTLALLLSMVLPSRRLAGMTTGMLLVLSFFINSLAAVNPDLRPLAKLSPLHYFQSGDAIHGLEAVRLVGLLTMAALFAGLAWWRYERRDIRVAGEGSWAWPWQQRQASS